MNESKIKSIRTSLYSSLLSSLTSKVLSHHLILRQFDTVEWEMSNKQTDIQTREMYTNLYRL